MSKRFVNKVAIITGASSGLGEQIAYDMAQEGASITLCGRDKQKLEKVLTECRRISGSDGKRFIIVAGDLTSQEHRKEIVNETIRTFGKLDVLIPNAGIVEKDIALTAPEDVYDRVMDTNVKAVFFLIQAAAEHLEKSKGSIVCMSSILGTMAPPGFTVYAVSKAALDHMVKCIAMALGPKGVRVNAVKPSYIKTAILRSTPDGMEEFLTETETPQHVLEGTRLGTQEEVSKATIFLASEDASFTTGEFLNVDGGRRFNSV